MATTTKTPPKTMRAWRYTTAPAGLENALKQDDAADQPPQPLGKHDILVHVHTTSLNPVDHKIPELGVVVRALAFTSTLLQPTTPGLDFAGIVAATGDAVDTFRVGERVFGRLPTRGLSRFGTLGEYVVARWDGVAALPDRVSFEQACCVGTSGLTAWQSIVRNVVDRRREEDGGQGDRVFINGGSGGCGTWGIQIAKEMGCHVTVSCSGRNAELCRDLGADDVIDYTQEDVSAALKARALKSGIQFKLVVDNVGDSPTDLYKAADDYLQPEGKFVQLGGSPNLHGARTTISRFLMPTVLGGGSRRYEFMMVKSSHEDLVAMGKWMREGKIRAIIDEVFEFEDAPKAVARVKSGRARGNVVVRVAK